MQGLWKQEKMHDDKLHNFLLKKIRKEIVGTQSIVHLSVKQKQITESFVEINNYAKFASVFELENALQDSSTKVFSHIIVDLDLPCCDDFENFVQGIKSYMSSTALLIIVATNLCTWRNKISFWFGNDLEDLPRPYRAVAPRFLRDRLLANGYSIRNRFWDYGDKILIMANLN
jgi:hypothetical protein